jgi:hypothetical protein
VRVGVLVTIVGLSFEVLMSNGCARRHYTITVSEVAPTPAPPQNRTLRGPADLRNGKERPQGSYAGSQPPAHSSETLVATAGDGQQRPQSLRGSSDANDRSSGSIGGQTQGSDSATEETSQPQLGSGFSLIGRVLLVGGVIATVVLFAGLARRRVGS